jgi:RHS repeat-associated protein
VATYQFDGRNNRVTKTLADGTKTDYFYDQQSQVLEERQTVLGQSSPMVTQYVWDQSYIDTPVVRFRDATGSGTYAPLYYTTDANHDVTAVADGAGVVQERYVYDAYGNVTFRDESWAPLTAGGNNSSSTPGVSSALDNQILYCGYRYDPETAVAVGTTFAAANYQVRGREYITQLSTFGSRDPIESSPNLYAYCDNDPTNATDPDGCLKIVSGDPKYTGNGEGTWTIKIELGPNETDGWVIQKVTADWEVNACNLEAEHPYEGSSPCYEPNKKPSHTDAPQDHGATVYWEMWRIRGGKVLVPDPDPNFPGHQREFLELTDKFAFSAKVALGEANTWGHYSQTGEMAFIPDSDSRPKVKGGWHVDPKGPAGNLWIANKAPEGWESAAKQVTRTWYFSWNNCPGEGNYDAPHPNDVLPPQDEHGGWASGI